MTQFSMIISGRRPYTTASQGRTFRRSRICCHRSSMDTAAAERPSSCQNSRAPLLKIFSPRSPHRGRPSPSAMGRCPRLPMATADRCSRCRCKSSRRGSSSSVRKIRGSTAQIWVMPAQRARSMPSSSSAGTYTVPHWASSSVSCSARVMEQVSCGVSGPGRAGGRGEGVPVRRWVGWVRAISSSSSTWRRIVFTALAGSIRPSASSTWVSLGTNTVPPVFSSRMRRSSAVRARFRAASGTGPSARTVCPLAEAVS